MNDESHLWTDEAVGRLPLAQARAELLEEIMSTDTPTRTAAPRPAVPAPSRRRWLVPVAAAAAVAALAVVATVPLWGGEESSAPAVPVAPGLDGPDAPTTGSLDQLVLDPPPGWTVLGAVRTPPRWLTVSYASPEQGGRLTIRRLPGREALDLAQDLEGHPEVTDPPADGVPSEVAGLPARTWAYGPDDRLVASQPVGAHRWEVRASGMDDAAFAALLADVRLATRAELEASLPED